MKRLLKPSDLFKQPSRKQATVMQAVGGYVNTGIVMVQGLLLIPLYIHYIGAHTYGLWLASGGILGMMTLMNFGVGSMLIQRISRAYGQKDLEQAGAYFLNGMIVYLFICLLFGLFGWGISFWLPSIFKMTVNEVDLLRSCFQLAVVAMTIGILNECLRSFGQAMLRPVIPMIGMAVGRIFGIVVTVWMLFEGFGLWAIPAGLLVTACVIFVVNLLNAISLFRSLGAKISLDQRIIREYVQTSPALLMGTVGNTVSQESEPLLITLFLSAEITTAYMIMRKAADMVFQLMSVVNGSVLSSFSHVVGEGNNKKTWNIVSKILLLFFASSLIGYATYVGANQAFVSLWVGENFVGDQNIIFFIGIAFFMRSMRAMLWQVLNGFSDFIYTSVVIMLEGVSKIALVVLFLSWFGLVGVPYALFISTLLSMTILGLRLKKRLLIKVNLNFMIRSLLSVIVLFGICMLFFYIFSNYKSWGMFVFYAVSLFGTLVVTFSAINFRMYKIYFKKGVV